MTSFGSAVCRRPPKRGATLAIELQQKGGFGGVFHAMHEDDVRRIMAHPRTMIASDGGVVAPGEGVPHPRNYGTFARVLSLYVREAGLMSFPEAIRKMSRLPAERLGLEDRGAIRGRRRRGYRRARPGCCRRARRVR